MTRSKATLAVACVIPMFCIACLPEFAVAGAGTTAWDPLSVGTSARYEAMRLGVAGADGVEGLLYNPASLSRTDGLELAAGFVEWYVDTYSLTSAVGGPLPHGAWAMRAVYFDEGTVRDLDIESGTFTDTYDGSDIGLAMGYGCRVPFARSLRVGVAGRFVQRRIQGLAANSVGFDAGLDLSLLEDHISIGLVGQNFGTSEQFGSEASQADRTTRSGIGLLLTSPDDWWGPLSATVGVQAFDVSEMDPIVEYGTELAYRDAIALRAGYSQENGGSGRLSYGLGASVGRFTLDYASSQSENLGSTHILTLVCELAPRETTLAPKTDSPESEPEPEPESHQTQQDEPPPGERPWWWGE